MTEAAAAGEPARSAPLRHDAGGKSNDGDQRSSLNSPSFCRQAQRDVHAKWRVNRLFGLAYNPDISL
jgi:hypothetical protein